MRIGLRSVSASGTWGGGSSEENLDRTARETLRAVRSMLAEGKP